MSDNTIGMIILLGILGLPFIISGIILLFSKLNRKSKPTPAKKEVFQQTPAITEGKPTIQARPFERMWARTFDYIIWGLAILVVRIILLTISGEDPIGARGYAFALFTIYFSWIPVEALLLSAWGTSPGKFMWEIRVTDESGGQLTYLAALKRSVLVWLFGVGIGIPLVSMVCAIYWGFKFTSRHPDPTFWDRKAFSIVRHGEPSLAKLGWLVIFYVAYRILSVFLQQ